MKIKKMTLLSMLLAVSIILSYLESMLPHFYPIPGMKLGLPNVIILFTLLGLGKKEALMISILRLLSISLLMGTLLTPGFLIGGFGALLSISAMILGRKSNLSPLGLSILGASFHNLGQVTMAYLLLDVFGIFYLLPFLLLAGIFFGLVTGFLVVLLLGHKPLVTLLNHTKAE